MSTRILSAGLWLLAALYAGSMLHGLAGAPEWLGPMVGLVSGGLIVGAPRVRVSSPRDEAQSIGALVQPDVISESL